MTHQEVGFQLLAKINLMCRRTELVKRRVHQFAERYRQLTGCFQREQPNRDKRDF